MAPQFQLPFEKPIYELEVQLEKLEAKPNPTATTKAAIRNMRVELASARRSMENRVYL